MDREQLLSTVYEALGAGDLGTREHRTSRRLRARRVRPAHPRRGSSVDVEDIVFHVWAFRDGLPSRMEMFFARDQALSAAKQPARPAAHDDHSAKS